ncbi:hypothetical protein LEAN103870_08035 [Legionella anisa]|uniref:Uncharacterized protein n=1 Tax=Legionella anisa TaxID=28082 RepID=A0AAX0WPX5_9GAMM|nr:hypothetical protein [Legionella anisa]AWN73222.1 hypothetical protein DLD14_04845 [Legionella anisa]KTC69498.1 hypothetical protein Lani_2687 [Legionella anisa]MBN5934801.1 hypothetical protein [Legionella anisa]MCW8424062.1 hypothetical protein [Legionella anisa]MCW8447585.1 hypothetical protein [Legionella anisa]
MGIFKDITLRYCQKILDTYQLQADEKTYKGKEAELLIQRNECARCLIKKIKEINVDGDDYTAYFETILKEIESVLKEVVAAVKEFNKEHSTTFTTDLYETFFTSSLINFINALNDLVQNSPDLITGIKDTSLFSNNRTVPWVNQFSFILYEYILEKELDYATNKGERDIFDVKKQLILKYVQNAGNLHARFKEDETDTEYQALMRVLLTSMSSEEKSIQRRKSNENNTGYMSYLSQTFYKASEKVLGKNQLGQKIELLTKEFNERTTGKGLVM